MKTFALRHPTHLTSLLLSAFVAALVSTPADAAPAEAVVVDRGPHHRTWRGLTQQTLQDGRVVDRTNSYVELGTGMHFWKDNQWQESKAQFRLFPGGAVADEGPFQLIVAPDVAEEGAVDLLAPGSKRFRISPRWLAYHDLTTGQSVMIAAVKSCVGQLIEPNVIVFPDAFDDVQAAIRMSYQTWGAEQEVLLLESGPLNPADWGLNGDPANIVLEMWSEFHTWPEGGTAIVSVEGGLNDVKLVFGEAGEAQIGIGKAFSLGDEENSIAVGKTWTRVDGQRQFLIEAVRQSELAPLLAGLPQQAQANNPAPRAKALAQRKPVAGRAGLLAQGTERLTTREKRTQTAAIQPARTRLGPGVSIDYSVITTISNLRLKADTTYYVTNSATLSGTTTIEGGTVIKFSDATTPPLNRLLITGSIDCQTDQYRPAFFTAKDDDTIGEIISGSTGTIGTNRYGSRALDLNAASTTYNLHDLRFRHPDKAVYVSSSTAILNLSHSQIGHANIAVNQNVLTPTLRNVLVHDAFIGIVSANGRTAVVEHVTFHRVGNYFNGSAIYLTNSLLICVTNGSAYTGSNNATNINDAGIFQTVGAGSRYLSSQSTYRNAGTTFINPTLLTELGQRTTYPPLFLSNSIAADFTFFPQAQRDVDVPDLGYHFDPLDFVVSGVTVNSNVTVTATGGVAIGIDYVHSSWGFILDSARFLSQGSPTRLNRIVRAHLVQEAGTGNPGTRAQFYDNGAATRLSEARFRFTEISQLANDGYFLYSGQAFSALEWTHSRGYNLSLVVDTSASGTLVCGLTNTLWEQGGALFGVGTSGAGVNVHLRNNLLLGLNFQFLAGTTNWTVRDNLFDSLSVLSDNGSAVQNWTNAYYNTTYGLTGGVANTNLASLTYEVGPLGDYYQPTNSILINKGTRTADLAGLYHFTTTTNQVKDTNSWVDIGPHFVALNGSNQPLDTDGDGTPDYFEDLDGDGIVDPGETDWNDFNDLGLHVLITKPRNGSIIP